MFETADVVGTGTAATCPDGFTLVVTYCAGSRLSQAAGGRYVECLKLKPNMQNVAAFFETRRLAGYLGATNEFEKLEGITYNPITKKAYAAMARITNGALVGTANGYNYDLVGRDEMRLPENRCGGVLELDLDSSWHATRMTVLIAGTPAGTAAIPLLCDVNGIAGPDNLHVVPGTSTLLIAEDVDPEGGHPNNFLWAYDTLKPAQGLTRIATAPYDAEISGIYTAFVGDRAYLMLMQHPAINLDPSVTLGTSAPGYVAYIGPIPIKALTGVGGVKPTASGKTDKKTEKRISTERDMWMQAKALQELTFEALPYELPPNDAYNAIEPASTGQVCGAPRKKGSTGGGGSSKGG